MMIQKILENSSNPHGLEELYQSNPDAFAQAFPEVWEQNPTSTILAVWNERLNYKSSKNPGKFSIFEKKFVVMGILSLLAGAGMRAAFYFVNEQSILPINLFFGYLPFLAIFFVLQQPPKKAILYVVFGSILAAILFVNFLPREGTDSILLSQLHLPVFLWLLIGLAFTGNEFRVHSARLSFLRFNGNFAVVYGIMAVGGIVLTGLTISLFTMVDLEIVDIYMENVVVFGAAALAIVATYLVVNNLALPKNIVPMIAKIFSPLILTTLVVYLITILWVGKNPFLDRDFLLVFNGVLLIVLAITIFSITERGESQGRTISDSINFALIVLALIIDAVALSAIVFRLTSYGLTPNRLAVLGVNIVVLVHLAWILFTYFRFLRGKASLVVIQDVVAMYLPVYGIWAAVVAFTFPLLFP
jgi:hypothetical protein